MRRFLRLFGILVLGLFLGAALGLPAWGAEPVTIWAGPPQEHAVALTFDDGPSPRYTAPILSLLKRYGARGTFFVQGCRAEKYPGLVRAELRDGNEVGNHSFDHPRLTGADQRTREQELERTSLDLDLLGCPCTQRLFRPPYSAYDSRLVRYLAHTNRKLVLWSLDSGDWRGLDAPTIVENVLGRVHNGSIIIFHDGDETSRADRRPTVAALARILPALRAAGYRMVTVSELVDAVKPPPPSPF
jgi:peptidoglycan/xylan/chitin deacetylase (PgdA/CDA1 family)